MKQLVLEYFFKDGWLTKRGRWTCFTLGWVLMLGPLWLATIGILSFSIAFLLFCIGLVFGLANAYEGRAKLFGYQAPFTSDPIGWQKAKKSYQADADADADADAAKDHPSDQIDR